MRVLQLCRILYVVPTLTAGFPFFFFVSGKIKINQKWGTAPFAECIIPQIELDMSQKLTVPKLKHADSMDVIYFPSPKEKGRHKKNKIKKRLELKFHSGVTRNWWEPKRKEEKKKKGKRTCWLDQCQSLTSTHRHTHTQKRIHFPIVHVKRCDWLTACSSFLLQISIRWVDQTVWIGWTVGWSKTCHYMLLWLPWLRTVLICFQSASTVFESLAMEMWQVKPE